MSIETVFFIAAILIFSLAVLLFFYFSRYKNKKEDVKHDQEHQKEENKEVYGLEILYRDLQNKKASSKVLKQTLDMILKKYGSIDDIVIYEEILKSIVIHPNTNKNLILDFDKELSRRNPQHKKAISNAVTNALNSR